MQKTLELHIITPVSRPHLLPQIADSIREGFKQIKPVWYCCFDKNIPIVDKPLGINIAYWDAVKESGCWGYNCRNQILNLFKSGWVYFLDDDNLIHPNMEEVFLRALEAYPECRWFVFRQIRSSGDIYLYETDQPRLGTIDMGQCILDRELIGGLQFENKYAADGVFYEQLAQRYKPIAISEAAVYYNALR
ncbi:MAG: hypothetical protein KatS3mg087_0111 [Patescibacteria group bacterium]|nr:MAG: hypothetical protein KatS3mg087_0111 [Patescibacteria group bacterium]